MNNIRFISQDLEWTESMKESVRHKIVEPLERHMKAADFDLAVHLGMERKRMSARQPSFVMSLVLQTFDGRKNELVRRQGGEFTTLVNDVSSHLRLKVRKHKAYS
jgi:ribosome-associated translation inhibitor RaiA